MAEASAAASQIAGGEWRAVSAAHVTPQRLHNIYVHSGKRLFDPPLTTGVVTVFSVVEETRRGARNEVEMDVQGLARSHDGKWQRKPSGERTR